MTELVGHGRRQGDRNRPWADCYLSRVRTRVVRGSAQVRYAVAGIGTDARHPRLLQSECEDPSGFDHLRARTELRVDPAGSLHKLELMGALTDARRSGLGRSHPNPSRVNQPQPCR